MKVLKFGGTSVGTVNSLRNVKQIVDSLPEPAIVVVSALGGLTDKLIATAREAAAGLDIYRESMSSIRERHYEIIKTLVPEQKQTEVHGQVTQLLDDLEQIYTGLSLIKSLPDRTLDLVVSFGERMSSLIVTAILKDAEHHDSLTFIRTERWFNKDIADRPLTEKLITAEFELPLKHTAVMGGFISTCRDTGEITNLGRGGSDYSAALVAATLDAEELDIWTDVDGFMTSDPRIIKNARIIPDMTFVESMELCSYGAKVIYPPTIYPVFHKNIPIKILNTFNPSAPGTFISDHFGGNPRVTGVSVLKDVSLITIKGVLATNIPAINSRAYNVLARNGVGVLLVAQPGRDTTFAIALGAADADRGHELLSTEFAPELQRGDVSEILRHDNLSILAIVGESIKKISGLGARIVNTLQRNNIDVMAISDGASDTTIAMAVDSQNAPEALKLAHDATITAS